MNLARAVIVAVVAALVAVSCSGGGGEDQAATDSGETTTTTTTAAPTTTTTTPTITAAPTTTTTTTTTTAAPTTTAPDTAFGAIVFATNCATCHGEGGIGEVEGEEAPTLIGNGLGPEAILAQVELGSDVPFMPAFGADALLTAEEIEAVVAYVDGL